MEKRFTKESQVKAFHEIIINLMNGKEKVIISKDDIYDEVETYLNSSGKVFKNTHAKSNFRNGIINKITELLKKLGYIKSSKSIDKTAKIRKSNLEMEVLIPSSDTVRLENIIKTSLGVPVVKVMTTSGITPIPTTWGLKRKPQKKVLLKIYKVLVAAEAKGGRLEMDQVRSAASLPTYVVPCILKKQWDKAMIRGLHIDFKMNIINGGPKGHSVEFINVKGCLLSLAEKLEKYYGVDTGYKKAISSIAATHVKKSITSEEKTDKVIESMSMVEQVLDAKNTELLKKAVSHTEDNFQKSRTLYIIAALCKKSGIKNILDFYDLSKTLAEKFNIRMSAKDIAQFIKEEGEGCFTVNTSTSRPGVAINSEADWMKIRDGHHPDKFVTYCLARIGCTIEEIKQVAPGLVEVETLSRINSNDAIYRVYYRRSEHGFSELCRLFSTFRGKDQILDDDDLVNNIKNEIFKRDALLYSSLSHKIEVI